jgi:glycine reductase
VTGIYPDNPGVETYRQYKDRTVYAFPTTEVVSGMGEVLPKIAQCLSKIATGIDVGTPAEEGYITRGHRRDRSVDDNGAVRAVRMLIDKLAGRPFITEIPVESLETIPVPAKMTNLKDAQLAIVTTSGVIARGNPDGFRGYQNTKWTKYSIENMNSMLDGDWDVIHGGYNTEFMKKNPNFGVPLDACRDMEKEGLFAKLYPHFYVVPGARGLLSIMHQIGKEMALDMKADGVDGVILVST